jgi:hypothetical protein
MLWPSCGGRRAAPHCSDGGAGDCTSAMGRFGFNDSRVFQGRSTGLTNCSSYGRVQACQARGVLPSRRDCISNRTLTFRHGFQPSVAGELKRRQPWADAAPPCHGALQLASAHLHLVSNAQRPLHRACIRERAAVMTYRYCTAVHDRYMHHSDHSRRSSAAAAGDANMAETLGVCKVCPVEPCIYWRF